jgi:diguanylate cyclase (GGDEF)-like protein
MRVQIAGLCFTDASGAGFHYDLPLVAISYFIAVAGSFSAFEMIERWRNAEGIQARYWQLASASALGGSIWSTHFVAMLALRIDLPLTYSPGMALLSLLTAIGVVAFGLQVLRSGASLARIGIAGIFVGLGIAAMHYIGMAGVRFPGHLAYKPGVWGLSLLVGVTAATVGLWLSLVLQQKWQRAVAALVVGGAICALHYTGMAATVFEADPLAVFVPGLPTDTLAAAVALTTLLLILLSLVFVGADRRQLAMAMHEAEVLRRSNEQLTVANAKSELDRRQLDTVMNNISQGICFFDSTQRLRGWNRRYVEIYRLSPASIRVGLSLDEIVNYREAAGSAPEMLPPDYLVWRNQIASSGQVSKTEVTLKNGRVVAIYHHPMPDGGWVSTHEDITERQLAQAEVEFIARHDALTRLPNSVTFHDRLEHAIGMTGRGSQCAVLCLDLDRFKIINDTLGHPIGDGLLRAAADRLRACVREVDTLARLGGDEFAILQLDVKQPDDARLLADRIIGAFHNPFDIEGHRIVIGTSVGVAMSPGDGTSAGKLIKNADIALYLAKAEGRGTARFFEPEVDARIQSRRTLELDLRNALSRNEFEVYYQPQINVRSWKIVAFEALLRWNHPARGLIPPAEFIPVSEETGLVFAIGEWVLLTACYEAENWPADIKVAVNLSPVQFQKGDLVATVQAALDASRLRPDRLELEITESIVLQYTFGSLDALRRLRAMGITVALDDFGTGYSSLSYLHSLPFDKIKIDQSFVCGLEKNEGAMSIIHAVAALGRDLCVTTSAEGVETKEQLDKLREEGCTEVQGFLFSRPKPASEIPSIISSFNQNSEVTM